MSRPTRQSEQYIRRRKARRRRAYFYRALAFAMLISVVMFIMLLAGFVLRFVHGVRTKENIIQTVQNFIFNDIGKERVEKPEMVVDLLNVNDYSRPGTDIEDIKTFSFITQLIRKQVQRRTGAISLIWNRPMNVLQVHTSVLVMREKSYSVFRLKNRRMQ